MAIDRLRLQSGRDVELAAVVLPRLVDETAELLVERKSSDADRAVRHGLFVHRPPDARAVVLQTNVLRLRSSVARLLLHGSGTIQQETRSGDEIAYVNIFTTTFSTTFTQCAPAATEFGKITQNTGHYAIQGHSRSPILVPIESSYTTSY